MVSRAKGRANVAPNAPTSTLDLSEASALVPNPDARFFVLEPHRYDEISFLRV